MFGALHTGNEEVREMFTFIQREGPGRVSGASGKVLPPRGVCVWGGGGVQRCSPDNNTLSCTIVFMCFLYYI